MGIKTKFYTFISLVLYMLSLLSFLFLSLLFEEQLILYLSIPIASGILFFFSIVLNNGETKYALKITCPHNLKISLIGLVTFCMLVVLFVPAFDGSMLEWMKISPLNWLRYMSALLLTSFLPGYLLLKVVDKKREIKGCITIVLSYLLSLFIAFLIGFLILLSSNSISALGLPIVITTNLALIATYYFTSQKVTKNHSLTLNPFELGLIVSIVATILAGSLMVMSSNMPLTSGDMHRHHGLALQVSQSFPVYAGNMIVYPGGYLFHIYLATVFALSGIPPALAEQGLYILCFMPVLAFYSATKAWFSGKEEKIPVIATFLSILLGLGSLYALYLRFTQSTYNIIQLLRNTTLKTYDIYMRILYLPDIVAPIWNIGLPVFFALLYFLKKDAFNLTKTAIMSILIALGWLGHAAEIALFILILFIYTLFIRQSDGKEFGLCIVLGLLLVLIIDIAAPAQIYIRSLKEMFSLPFFASLSLAILLIITEGLKEKRMIRLSGDIKNSLSKIVEALWRYSMWILLYAYIFSLIVWLVVEWDFNVWKWGGYTYTPFFVFPLRLGAVGLLAIISILLYFTKIIRDSRLLFFLMLIPLGFILEQAANYYLPYYPAYRYATLTFIGALVIAAFGIINLTKSASKSMKTITCILLIILMIFGLLSTTLYYTNASYYSKYAQLSQKELDAIDYIRKHTSLNSSVLTFTTESANKLRAFAGINAVQDAQRWSKLLLSTSNPYVTAYVLALSNVKYIYISQKDAELINLNKILKSMINYFPKVFENDYVIIHEVPPLTPPSSNASLGVLHFSPWIQKLEDTPWVEYSFTEGWHPYRRYGKVKSYESEVENGIMEITVISNQSGNVWASYALSSLSLNTTTYSTLSFRYRVENDLTWFTLQLWNSSNKVFLYIGHLTDKEFTTKTFPLPENQTIAKIEIIAETVQDAPANTTARTYIDFIKFSSTISSWKDDTFLREWTFYRKYGDVLDWNAHSDGDILKINVTSNQEGNVWISYSLPLALKTKGSVLSFRYRVDNDYTWFTIILQNASHRFFFYRGHLTEKTFTMESYPLPDDQTITRVEIIVETTDKAPAGTSAIAYLDYIEISQRPFTEDDVFPALFAASLQSQYSFLYVDSVLMKNINMYFSRYTHILLTSDPPIAVEDLLSWVSAGNRLTVFNTHGNGFFADLLRINSSSPLLSTRNLGLGKVVYINLEVDRKSELLKQEFIEEIREALALDKYVHKVDILPVYNSTFSGIKIDGDFSLLTDTLKLQGSVNLMGPPFQLNGSAEIVVYGEVTLTIKNASLLIFPSESYMIIKPKSYPVEGEVLFEGYNTLIVTDTDAIYNSSTPVSFKFKATGVSLNARLPSINASGTITFDQLDVHEALYIPLAGIVQQKAEVQGNVKFNTMYTSNTLIVFSMFKADGKILNLAATTSKPTIPWLEVLSSPYNLAFNTVFLSGIIIYAFKKRKVKQTVKEEKNGNTSLEPDS